MKPNKTPNQTKDALNNPYHELEALEEGDEPVSKTKRKAAMDELQDIGVTLVGLPKDKLNKLDLPEILLDAVNEAKRITANGATRRQAQYIGRLMRNVDIAPIIEQLARWDGKNTAENAYFHRLENWRTRLIADENSLSEFLVEYPGIDTQQIRTLIRNARREESLNKPPKSSRELFKLLREVTAASQHASESGDTHLDEESIDQASNWDERQP